MKAENFEERKRLFRRFVFLYAGSLGLIVLAFYVLTGRGDSSPEAAGGSRTSVHDRSLIAALRSDLDSAQRQIRRMQKEGVTKDSLISQLVMKPVLDGADLSEEKELIARLRKEDAKPVTRNDRSVDTLQAEKEGLQRQLLAETNAGTALKNQVSNLQQLNEGLRIRLKNATVPGSQAGRSGQPEGAGSQEGGGTVVGDAPAGRTVELLNAELRLAEVNCDLSRADARQVVYKAKQRQELLTEALGILTQLVQSPDVEIQKKARQKMAELRSIVSTVHD